MSLTFSLCQLRGLIGVKSKHKREFRGVGKAKVNEAESSLLILALQVSNAGRTLPMQGVICTIMVVLDPLLT